MLYGGLDAHRIQFTVGRDIRLPESSTEVVNYSIYPHVEIDGKRYESVTRTFTFKDRG